MVNREESSLADIVVTFRQTESTEALRTYAVEKVQQVLKKYNIGTVDAKVVLSVQKRDHTAEVIIHGKNFSCSPTATTEDLYSSIDKVSDTLAELLRRHKDKLRDRHKSDQIETMLA